MGGRLTFRALAGGSQSSLDAIGRLGNAVGEIRVLCEDRVVSSRVADPLPGSALAAFVAAVETSSVHGAADALDLTSSAVTKRIKGLERRLGVTLFERGRFGLRPTDTARLLYPEAREALAALARAEGVAVAERDHGVQSLTVAASHTVGECLLPGWLAAVRVRLPRVRARVDVVNSEQVLAGVREERFEIGFVEGLDPLDGLDTLVVRRDELVAVVGPDHRWVKRSSVRAKELEGEAFLAREAGSGTRAVADRALARAGVELVPALEFASIQGVKRALAAGGFGVMSELAIEAELQVGSLHALPVRDIDLMRTLHAVRVRGGTLQTAAQALWRLLSDLAA